MSGHQRVSGMQLNPNFASGGHPTLVGGVGPPGTRSWHPSPFASDDEIAANDEPQFYKVKYLKIGMNLLSLYFHISSIYSNTKLNSFLRRKRKIESKWKLHGEETKSTKTPVFTKN